MARVFGYAWRWITRRGTPFWRPQHRNGEEPWSRERFTAALGRVIGGDEPSPDVDLLIRTGGEQRLSDFLLWECAYAEDCISPRVSGPISPKTICGPRWKPSGAANAGSAKLPRAV